MLWLVRSLQNHQGLAVLDCCKPLQGLSPVLQNMFAIYGICSTITEGIEDQNASDQNCMCDVAK